jgi:hypothetical protein
MAGTITADGHTINGAVFDGGNITNSSLTLSPGNKLNVASGTIVFANDQISGNWISGGVADTDISGTAAYVRNGVYTTQFGANTILKADATATPVALTVPEGTLVGRITGGVITALTAEEARDLIDVAQKGEENVVTAGALMRTGSTSAYEGAGAMIGAMFLSFERVILQANQSAILSQHKQITYITVTPSNAGDTAIVNVPKGIQDGHVRTIVVSSIATGTKLRLVFSYTAPSESVQPSGLWAYKAGASITLIYDALAETWISGNAGMYTREPTGFVPNLVT